MAILTIGFNPAIDRILQCADFHLGGHQMAVPIARLASGKAANVNRALAQLSTDSIATGFVGQDDVEFFHEQLISVGPGRILCRFVEVLGETRENITILDPKRRQETHIREPGFAVSAEEAALLERKIAHELKAGDIAVFSGSLCQGITAKYLTDLIDRCENQQAKVAIDTSGDPLRAATSKKLWLLKPNLEELGQLTGTKIPPDPAAVRDAALPLSVTIEHLLVTLGPAGAVLITAQGSFFAQMNFAGQAVRTVGCGDHLLAGYLAEITAGRDPDRALHVAVAVATARALSPRMEGFDPALQRAAMDNITIEKL